VAIAGQTVDQARKTIERHVAHYVTDPKVTLQRIPETANSVAATPAETTANDGWRPAVSATNNSRINAVVSAGYPSVVSHDEPAASLGPVRGTQRAQAPPEWKADAAPPEELPAPRSTSDAGRLHPEPATPVTTLSPFGSAPHELAKANLPPYVIEPPDILLVEAKPEQVLDQPIAGQHLVRPDGTISLGYKGSVFVSGMTLDQAREAVYQHLKERGVDIKPDKVNVDVIAYNSKVYYVITDGAGYGEQVVRVPVTGNETVLDAIGQINGLPPVSSKRCIWVARRTPGDGSGQQILPVDWISITERGATVSNYQLLPGDRLYVHSDKWLRLNSAIDKRIAPFERILGATLLGSSTVNSIRNRGTTGTGTPAVP
jgi:polysaccharide export outer membrane protein